MTNRNLSAYEREYVNWVHGDPLKCSLNMAHAHSMNHRAELMASIRCGCFYCGDVFRPSRITAWINDAKERTACCPGCGIDAVLGDVSGYPITPEFIARMRMRRFGDGMRA